jgi:hypothetical protein
MRTDSPQPMFVLQFLLSRQRQEHPAAYQGAQLETQGVSYTHPGPSRGWDSSTVAKHIALC